MKSASKGHFKEEDASQKIAEVDGVGPLIATEIVAAIADGKAFRNGRHVAAWLGLVPRQHSSGDEQRLLRISKRDPYLRILLIHGARSLCVPLCYENGQPKPLDCRQTEKTWDNLLAKGEPYSRAA